MFLKIKDCNIFYPQVNQRLLFYDYDDALHVSHSYFTGVWDSDLNNEKLWRRTDGGIPYMEFGEPYTVQTTMPYRGCIQIGKPTYRQTVLTCTVSSQYICEIDTGRVPGKILSFLSLWY